jgi:uncharacterized repeat protein (TIGR01451 family)
MHLLPGCDADLGLEKGHDPRLAVAGEALSYTLLVYNNGPSEAENVVVVDDLPDGLTLTSAMPSPSSTSPLSWFLGAISDGDCQEIHLMVQVDPGISGTITNTAVVTSSTCDSNAVNNEAKDPTGVTAYADLRIHKGRNLEKAIPGDELTYTLRVSNGGPSEARRVVVSDTLPVGVNFHSSMPPLLVGPDLLTWHIGSLALVDAWTIEIKARVGSNASGMLVNAASVTSDVDDPDLSNNRDEARTLAPVVVTNKAYICQDALWCKESNSVVNSPFQLYLLIILRTANR